MARIGLATYVLRVKRFGTNEAETLGRLGSGIDFIDLIGEYLQEREKEHVDQQAGKAVLKAFEHILDGRCVSGRMGTGTYGRESSVVHRQTGVTVTRIGKDHSNLHPLYFMFEVPKNSDEGVVMLQKEGLHGLKGALETDLNNWMTQGQRGYRVEIAPLAPAQVWERFINPGRITKLRLVKFCGKSDLTDMLFREHIEHAEKVEVVVTARRNGTLGLKDKLFNVLQKPDDRTEIQFTDLVEITGFEYDSIKVEFALGKGRYTLDLARQDDVHVPYDITDLVKEGDDGHPDFFSIDLIAKDLKDNHRSVLVQKKANARQDKRGGDR